MILICVVVLDWFFVLVFRVCRIRVLFNWLSFFWCVMLCVFICWVSVVNGFVVVGVVLLWLVCDNFFFIRLRLGVLDWLLMVKCDSIV